MYAIKFSDTGEKKKAKGVVTNVVKKHLNFDKYKEALFSRQDFRHNNISIRHKNHELSLVETNKQSLSPLDTKRYILDDGITSYAYGHFKIPAGGNSESAGTTCNSSLTNERLGPLVRY